MRQVPGLLLYPRLAPDGDSNSVSKFGESFVDIECVKREFLDFYLGNSKFRAFLHRMFFFFALNVFIRMTSSISWSRSSDTTNSSIHVNFWGTRRRLVQLGNGRRVKTRTIDEVLIHLLDFSLKSKLCPPIDKRNKIFIHSNFIGKGEDFHGLW